ncbi:MAG: PilZ domain-containing protein [Candidatus Rokubacteria bacterium]|nr:PilZ domain-containing protein [Candidatus Rokubacteria bacterium]
MMEERRKHPRATISLDVTVWHTSGREWDGESVDVSPGGLNVKFAGDLEPGSMVTLIFTLPDGGPMISALSAVVRKSAEGQCFAFASLSYADLVRLQKLVRAHIAGSSPGPTPS